MYVILLVIDRYSILQRDKNCIMGEIRDVLLRSLKDHPEVLKKLEMEESDDKTKALIKMILKEIQDDPEYSGINH